MKILRYLLYLFFLSAHSGLLLAQENRHTIEKLKFLSDDDLERGMLFAKEQSRPVMIYFNSWDCASCEKFAANVMSVDTIQSFLKSKYICLKANVDNADASAYARNFKVAKLPQIVLVSRDQESYYLLDMKLDVDITVRQAAYFLNAMALKEQTILFQKTNSTTFEKSLEAMAKSYAKRDFNKNSELNPEDLIFSRCLKMKIFDKFSLAYRKEWAEIKQKKKQ